MSSPEESDRDITRIWATGLAPLVAALARSLRDIGLAEAAAHGALKAALRSWPASGVPADPAAWLRAAARDSALELARRHGAAPPPADLAPPSRDDLISLLFVASHPKLPRSSRVALLLRWFAGLSTPELARAFLASEAGMAQRIAGGKLALVEARVAHELPSGPERAERVVLLLEVVYLCFNEGYLARPADGPERQGLVATALQLGQRLVQLLPDEPETHGLLALMQLSAARASSRSDPSGKPVPLLDQDPAAVQREAVQRGLAALAQAESRARVPGPYQLQAAIAACHASAPSPEATDWRRITALYTELAQRHPSPAIELNRAFALSRAEGPTQGLALLDTLTQNPALAQSPLLPAARADLLERLGRLDEARQEFQRAAALTKDDRQKQGLLARAAAVAAQPPEPRP